MELIVSSPDEVIGSALGAAKESVKRKVDRDERVPVSHHVVANLGKLLHDVKLVIQKIFILFLFAIVGPFENQIGKEISDYSLTDGTEWRH